MYYLKFTEWRLAQLVYTGKEVPSDYYEVIEIFEKRLKQIQDGLFEGIDPYSENIIRQINGRVDSKTGKNRSKDQLHSAQSPRESIVSQSFLKNSYYKLGSDPGPRPIFISMPSREEVQRMIIKATQFFTVGDVFNS
mmetsp:Transcript_31710/g.31009  ORF Transcript_31710/g.31009 Transcript_31710/m.31009 type:complete len:137 (-) Transcript_31710:28-438(-)